MLDAQADHLVATLFERYPRTPVLLVVARPEDAAAFFADGTTAGLYEHARRRLITRDIGESLRHEFTHLLHHAQMERLGQRHPIWIQEGLASLYEHHRLDASGRVEFLPNSRHNVAYRAARAAVARPLRELVGLSHREFMDESTRLYPQSRALFEFIAAEAGLPRFWQAYLETFPESELRGLICYELGLTYELGLDDGKKGNTYLKRAVAVAPNSLGGLLAARRLEQDEG